jgi:uncharacterized surface protein with fasciclin (FAS1) repeats
MTKNILMLTSAALIFSSAAYAQTDTLATPVAPAPTTAPSQAGPAPEMPQAQPQQLVPPMPAQQGAVPQTTPTPPAATGTPAPVPVQTPAMPADTSPPVVSEPALEAPITSLPPSATEATAAMVQAQAPKTVGGVLMYPSKNIVENAALSKDHTTLVSALKAAGLVSTLSGPGPYTVFAPTNAAFAKFPPGAVKDLEKPENAEKLRKLLTYHVIAGNLDSKALMAQIKDGGGKATLTPLSGGTLTLTMDKKNVLTITDDNKNVSHVAVGDVYQSNGVIHVVDTVVIPK